MLIRTTCWSAIRDQFTEDEKAALRAATTGETICPPGITLDPIKLDAELEQKLTRAVNAWRASIQKG